MPGSTFARNIPSDCGMTGHAGCPSAHADESVMSSKTGGDPGSTLGQVFRTVLLRAGRQHRGSHVRAAKCGYFVADVRSFCRNGTWFRRRRWCGSLPEIHTRGCRRCERALCRDIASCRSCLGHMHDGSAMQGAFLARNNKEPRTWRGLIQLFPLAYSGSARAWLGETVQLALTTTISDRKVARCDGHHILAHSEPPGGLSGGSRKAAKSAGRRIAARNPRLIIEDDSGYGCLVISAQDARRVACDRCM
jgi:hypothetical protein